jgi:PAS domain S-box-containing protein
VPGARKDTAYEQFEGDRRRLSRSSDVRAAPLGGGRVVVTSRDVTDHTRMEEQLRLQSAVLGRAAEGVVLVRASDGTIVYANPRFTEIMGYDPGELDGRPVAEINWEDEPGDGERLVRQIMADLEHSGEASYEVRNRRKDGSLIWTEAHIVGFDHPDHGKVWVAVQQDVTSRKEAQSSGGDGGGLSARWQR